MRLPAKATHQQTRAINQGLVLRTLYDLLRASADVYHDDDCHPAYEGILAQLAPDEGRILRYMATEGPQASVDVRTGGPIGMVSSQLIAPGLTMIGANAGCRRPER